jgi:hypothetical protein
MLRAVTRRRRRPWLPLVLLLLAGALSCGDDDGPSADAAPGPHTGPATDAAPAR